MKIGEVKEAILRNGFSDELFEELKISLKRSPKAQRSQHLYTFAYELATEKDDFDGATKMICYAINFCENSWVDLMRAYENSALIYEVEGLYKEAYEAYASALGSVPEEHKSSYIGDLSIRMMKAYLHMSGFSYTPHLRELYEASREISEFAAGFRGVIYYTSIAEMIIAANDGDKDAYAAAKGRALDTINDEESTATDIILARHKYKSEAGTTAASIKFLNRSKWK